MTVTEDAATRTAVSRLRFIEGLRGVAAIGVCLHHLVYLVPGLPPNSAGGAVVPEWVRLVLYPLIHGDRMVALFLLISGFSLYYSERLRRDRGDASSLRQFALRRAWRILPLYYAAFVVGSGLTASSRAWGVRTGQGEVGQLTLDGVLSHLLLVHNWNTEWAYQGNAPLWSIAYEVQVYALFPLMLLLARHLNIWVAVTLVALPLSVISRVGLPHPVFGLVGWFAVGVLTAHWCMTRRIPVQAGPIALLGGLALCIGVIGVTHSAVVSDAIWCTAFVCAVLSCYAGGRCRRPLESQPVLWLGARSYSLYAMHYPVALVLLAALQALGAPEPEALAAMLLIGTPVSLLAAAAAYRLIELPSLRRVRIVR